MREQIAKQKKSAPAAINKKNLNSDVRTELATTTAPVGKENKSKLNPGLPKELLLNIHDLMVKSRKLEERLIQVYKKGEAFFWIGGPGEEAFGVPLGLLTKKGEGPHFDYLHLHYRCTPTLVAMGLDMKDSLRLIMNRATDPSTGGRNFSNHYCFPKWNVLPVSSPIEVQYGVAIGTAIAQSRRKTDSVSIVTGGDAGSAEGDFASCMIWASRPGNELPIYITIQNNRWGISTDYATQHGEKHVSDRGKPFGMRTGVYDANDAVEAYLAMKEDFEYIRTTRKPVVAEFKVSRLFGHSSASGANRSPEVDCITLLEEKLFRLGYLTQTSAIAIHKKYEDEAREAADVAALEPPPEGQTIWDHTYVGNENADWRKF